MALTQISTDGIKDGTITGTDLATNVDLVDNQKIRFGTGNDLEIFHNNSNQSIIKNDNSYLRILSDGVTINNNADSEAMIVAIANGATELYHDGSKKFETITEGAKITSSGSSHGLFVYHSNGNEVARLAHGGSGDEGVLILKDSGANTVLIRGELGQDIDITTGGDFDLEHDSAKLRLGAGNDLQIYHDGTSNIFLANSGDLNIRMNNSENAIVARQNGGAELYYNNVKKLETTSDGVKITAAEGGEAILSIHADEGDDNGDQYRIRVPNNDGFRIETGSSHETALKLDVNAGVELYYDNSKKFETRSGGLGVFGHIEAGDDDKLMLGDSNDLRIYHNGTNSIISNHHEDLYIDCQSDDLYLKAADNIFIQPQAGENGININGNGGVEIYYDNSKKLETQSDGAKVTGTFLVTGALYTQNEFNMTSQGNKFIDTAHKDHTLHFRRINDGDGGHVNQCTVSSDGVWSADFNDTSDKKLKENITTISDGAINKVKQLRPVNFDWKETDKANNVSGFIAQEIKTVLPNLVYGTEYDSTIVDEQTQHIKSTGYSVNTIGIVAHLTKALQEAITKIEVLETKVAALKGS